MCDALKKVSVMRDRSLPPPPLAKCNLSIRQIAKNSAQNTTFLKTADRPGTIMRAKSPFLRSVVMTLRLLLPTSKM